MTPQARHPSLRASDLGRGRFSRCRAPRTGATLAASRHHAYRHRGREHPARRRNGLSRRRPAPRTLRAQFPARGDQLCVLPAASRRDLRALGRQDAPHFRFAVVLPRTNTHDARLRGARELLRTFLAETSGLGDKLGVLLVRLPPSLAWDARVASTFFTLLREARDGPVACEPRHASWFEPNADRARRDVAAGGWLGPDGDSAGALLYYRWHGSPRVYRSAYDDDWLARAATRLAAWPAGAVPRVTFDNTAAGEATANALALRSLTGAPFRAP
jgi:uncharacterized protein YecE (DUF72 family)